MKLFALKIVVLLTLCMLPFSEVTNATFRDSETATPLDFRSSSFDLILTNTAGNPITGLFFDNTELKKDEQLTSSLHVTNEGAGSFYYQPSFINAGLDEKTCKSLPLVAFRNNIKVYEGLLSGLTVPLMSITDTHDEWEFILINTNEDEALFGEVCEFGIVFRAFQDESQKGFEDTEFVASRIGFALEPILTASYQAPQHSFEFTLGNIKKYSGMQYELEYDTSTVSQGVVGNADLSGENSRTVSIDLGTESDDTFVPHKMPHDFNLEVTLEKDEGASVIISSEIN